MIYRDFIREKSHHLTRVKSAHGYPCEFDKSAGMALKDYKIYGNSVQEGTPTPDAPVAICSVGDLVTDETSEYYGKYKISVSVNGEATCIYLDEPLRKFKDYVDYIDFKAQKVVRNVAAGVLTGSENWQPSAKRYYYYNARLNVKCLGNDVAGIKSNALPSVPWNWMRNSGTGISTYTNGTLHARIDIRADGVWSTVDEAKAYMRQNPISYIAPCLVPIEEDISLPKILTQKGINIIKVQTATEPSDIEVKYIAK